jgi:DNA polymerase-3 subunit gamma/tau
MPVEQVVHHLRHILSHEAMICEDSALWQLGRAAKCSMRDALSLTDQAIAYCGGELTETTVNQMLGCVDQSRVLALLQALRDHDAAAILRQVAELAEQGQDFLVALEDLLSLMHQVAVCQIVPDTGVSVQFDASTVQTLAQQLSAADVQLFYQMGSVAHKDLVLAPDIRSGFEMILLRMLAFRPQQSAQQMFMPTSTADVAAKPMVPSAKSAVSESVPEVSVTQQQVVTHDAAKYVVPKDDNTMMTATDQVDVKSITTKSDVCPMGSQVDEGLPTVSDDIPPWETLPETTQDASMVPNMMANATASTTVDVQAASAVTTPIAVAPETTTTTSPPSTTSWTLTDLDAKNWFAIFHDLPIDGMTRAIAANMVLTKRVDNQLTFTLVQEQSGVFNQTHQDRIHQSLESLLGCDLQLAINIGVSTDETPYARRQRRLAEHQQRAIDSLRQDPHVKQLEQAFHGQLDIASIRPVQPFEE